MELVCKSIPIEIVQNIKAYGPHDRNMSSPTARCVRYAMFYYEGPHFGRTTPFNVWCMRDYVGSLEEYYDLRAMAEGKAPGWEDSDSDVDSTDLDSTEDEEV